MLNKNNCKWDDLGTSAQITLMPVSHGDVTAECHVMLHVTPRNDNMKQQAERLYDSIKRLLSLEEMSGFNMVTKRYFLSDIANQMSLLPENEACAVSYIQQPPLDGSKIAAWIYMIKGGEVSTDGNTTVVRENGRTHLWTMSMTSHAETSAGQTDEILNNYKQILHRHGCNIADNCLRTWFFVRDVDTQYKGMIVARRLFFADNGLTDDTHYLASTGIGGVPCSANNIVQMDAYAASGMPSDAVRYLYASSNFIPASKYGATFERATLVSLPESSHIYVSGTASIDNKGEVMHLGDVVRQTHRMWDNVQALLEEGGMNMDDIMHIIVYLRDTADYAVVNKLFQERFPTTPFVITLAPVCRPTWLIEMECIAAR